MLVHNYEAQDHHAEWINAITNPKNKKLLIIAPPASAKSTWIGVIYTAWAIGKNRNTHVGYVTNSDLLSFTRSMAVRDIIETQMYQVIFPDVKPNPKRGWGQAEWFVERDDPVDPHPTFRACGLFGSITGFRWDLLIVDDICTQENTATPLQRKKTWEWFNETLMTRMTPNAQVVVIMTRWHHKDLAAELIKQGWKILKTPAIHEGKSYWPEQWPIEKLIDIRDGEEQKGGQRLGGIGSRAFEGHYQGNPTAEVGNILRWFPEYMRVPPLKTKMHRWDTAWSKEETADYSAMVSLGLGEDNHIYVLSGWRDRLETPELIEAIPALVEREKPSEIVIEETAHAKRVGETICAQTGLPIIMEPIKQRMDKTARANAAAPYFEAGMVLFPNRLHPNYGPWVEDLILECKQLPYGDHDDMADALIGGVLRIFDKLRWGERPPEYDVIWA